jgi:hypothetical protein
VSNGATIKELLIISKYLALSVADSGANISANTIEGIIIKS